jgi:hypothetical protein
MILPHDANPKPDGIFVKDGPHFADRSHLREWANFATKSALSIGSLRRSDTSGVGGKAESG